jgi:hypothetical protein
MVRASGLAMVVLVTAVGDARGEAGTKPIPVQLVHRDDKWQLLRDGKPFFIKGVGGDGSKQALTEAGGNAFRTWGADDKTGALLDEAHKLGLAVTVGIWVGHERHGFNYSNADQVAEQYRKVREMILRYKDHPGVLMWALGNEMEGTGKGDNAAIWSAVNNLAAMVKKLDPHHPTMTVVAEVGGDRVKNIHRLCPDIDIVGINSYGGVGSIPERYRQAGGTKPYVVTEFGPPGVWEIGRNAWGAAEEWTSTRKGEFYRKGYEALAADKDLCLGCFAFTWGYKQEATATWFGMFLGDGSKLEPVDVMTELWSGKPPRNRCPQIKSVKLVGEGLVEPNQTVQATIEATDPENDPLTTKWVLHRDLADYNTGGDAQPGTTSYPGAIVKSAEGQVELKMPAEGGAHRLYVYVHDGKGGSAVANLPLRVKGLEPEIKARPAKLPLVLVGDDIKAPYLATGWMGEVKSVTMDQKCEDQPHSGKTCLKVEYGKTTGWAGVVWQDPENDWGDKPGGYDLTGAKKLTFWARGAEGGEKVKFGLGLLGADKKYHDSAKGDSGTVELTKEWKQYEIDLSGKDLKRIKTGFYWTLGGQGKPLTFYIDDVQYE